MEMDINIVTNTPRNSLSLFRVGKLKELEATNKQLLERLQVLEHDCSKLTHDNNLLLEENRKFKILLNINTACASNNEKIVKNWQNINPEDGQINNSALINENEATDNVNAPTYETDEEELAKETEWIVQKNRAKKRKKPNSPELVQSNPTPSVAKQQVRVETNLPINRRPPPIIINFSENYNQLVQNIKKVIKGNFNIRTASQNVFKITTYDSTDYRQLTKHLSETNIAWHSYENKQERPIRVLAKYLPSTCEPEAIILDLKNKGFQIINAINKFQYRTKAPLNMFILCFEHTENVNKIYQIREILNTIVKIEPIESPKDIPQCKNCQSFNHTKNYCSKQPRCVRCAGRHLSKDCEKPKNTHVKCCNCGEQHPANYRGCMVAKELQKLRNKRVQLQKSYNQDHKNVKLSNEYNEPATSSLQFQEGRGQVETCNVSIMPQKRDIRKPGGSKSYSDVLQNKDQNTKQEENGTLLMILKKLENIEITNQKLDRRLIALENNFISFFEQE